MKEIIKWLIGMEQMAGEFYRDASVLLKYDKELKLFLSHLTEDEAWHFHVMRSAAEYIKQVPQQPSIYHLDDDNKARIEAPFHENRKKILKKTLTKESLLDCIVTTELSEWNYYFLYVINVLKEIRYEFTYAASKIEHHKKLIERYIENQPNNRKYLKKIRRLPKVWDVRILILEYNKPLRILLSGLLSTEGVVETAGNAEAGLKKISEGYYDIILVNDIMPGMKGVDIYKKAVQHAPLIADRFLFLMGEKTPSHIDFAKANKIKYLVKPVSIGEVKETMHDIMSKTPLSHIKKSSKRIKI